jgi:membrane-associated phospholipid phosphatase
MALKGTNPDGWDRVAEILSSIFHPFVIVILTMILSTVSQENRSGPALFWIVLSICVVILPLTYVIYSKVRSGQYSDSSVSIREQRHGLYGLAGFLFIVLITILVLGKAPRAFLASTLAGVLALAVAFLINRRYTKVSLHSMGISTCTVILLLTTPQLGILLGLFIPLVGWARIRLGHHTLPQVLIGFVVAVASVVLVFRLFHLY